MPRTINDASTDTDKLTWLRDQASIVGLALDNPTRENIERCQNILATAIAKTVPSHVLKNQDSLESLAVFNKALKKSGITPRGSE